MGTTTLPGIAAQFVRAINDHDAEGFGGLFAADALVDDAGREFRGLAAIKAWATSDIFDVNVTLEVLDVAQRDGAVVLTTKVDGDFDRTGLPDPVVIEQHIVGAQKIERLTCRLAGT